MKKASKDWEKNKRLEYAQDLIDIECDLQIICDSKGGGFLSPEPKEELINLETKNNKILEDREATWKLKSRALWLECGDENTKFFQAYVRSRKLTNTIWGLRDFVGRDVKSFDGLEKLAKDHFQNLFKANGRATIANIVRLTLFFPRFVNDEDNKLLYEVSEAKLQEVLHSFQKDKSPGPNGWSIEFFQVFYELIGQDLLAVVEESRPSNHVHAPLNSIFIALIPKSNCPQTMDDFKPISL